MAPTKLTLRDRLVDGTFRPDRHKELVLEEDLTGRPPPGFSAAHWRQLRDLQGELREARSAREQTRVAYAFAEIARRAFDEAARGEIDLERLLYVSLGPKEQDFPTALAYLGAWYLWGRWALPHGLAWRLRKGHADNVDLVKLDARYGESSNKPGEIAGRLDELAEAFWRDYGEEPVPEPPDVHHEDRKKLEVIGRQIKPRVRAWERERRHASR
jgi:hypothetical protein